ncbi:DUF551 domain-containing protein [Salmonella enterica subsp. enterica]|nr:DUF551 domain-containing protein [Salmonella enterica]
MKENQIRELVNELRDIAIEYHGTQQLRERIARTVRAAIIQGGSSPVTPDGWIPVSERMPEPYEYVLVTDGFDGCEVMRVNTDGYWGPAKSLYPGGITHWMPLPEPPQEVNRG